MLFLLDRFWYQWGQQLFWSRRHQIMNKWHSFRDSPPSIDWTDSNSAENFIFAYETNRWFFTKVNTYQNKPSFLLHSNAWVRSEDSNDRLLLIWRIWFVASIYYQLWNFILEMYWLEKKIEQRNKSCMDKVEVLEIWNLIVIYSFF